MAVCLDYQSVYVRPADKVMSFRLQLAAGVLLLVALGLKVWVKIESVELGYKLASERQRLLALDMDRRELELERSVLLRPDALRQRAHEVLGLIDIRPDSVVSVRY